MTITRHDQYESVICGVFNSSPVEQAGRTIGSAYVRQVSCWTTFIVIQQNKMAGGTLRSVSPAGNRCHFVLLDNDESCPTADLSNISRPNGQAQSHRLVYSTGELLNTPLIFQCRHSTRLINGSSSTQTQSSNGHFSRVAGLAGAPFPTKTAKEMFGDGCRGIFTSQMPLLSPNQHFKAPLTQTHRHTHTHTHTHNHLSRINRLSQDQNVNPIDHLHCSQIPHKHSQPSPQTSQSTSRV